MKKALMLRAEIPKDLKRVSYWADKLECCDDVWTLLFYQLCQDMNMNMNGEVWQYNSDEYKEKRYKLNDKETNLKEKWIPDIEKEFSVIKPRFDLIWARGGFQEYIPIIQSSKAFKIYYGAGRRFFPIPPNEYDLVLVDSPEQLKVIKSRLPNQNVSLFIKPAAENIFKPIKISKAYDVCISFQLASYTKRFELALDAIIQGGFTALVIGYISDNIKKTISEKFPNISFTGRLFRKYLPPLYSSCKVGLATHSQHESCPRVLPEFLACGLPIVVTKDTLFWKEKYITNDTGILVKPKISSIIDGIHHALNLNNRDKIRDYYNENLSLEKAANYLKDIINNIRGNTNT